ncbi:patatin-like phospholipase family protein [Variovorax paradoxus]|nr:patatin-like phospholipase family protein [Variovorax paradoxus]MBT2302055.1 patatin-like phospholipase family protein [Variovorax paradoxus]
MNATLRRAGLAVIIGLTALMRCSSVGPVTAGYVQPRSLGEIQASRDVASASGLRPKVALVLGGGGLRGFAHTGVLRALEEAGVDPDIVVGTSVGAVVGAAYASGMSASQIDQAKRELNLSSLFDWTFSRSGLIRGNRLAKWVDEVTRGKPIESFPRRFAAVATDLHTERAVLLDRGDPGAAVQASAAIPGMVVPVNYDGGVLIDGGIASLVPVRFARAMGADFVIAVDIYCSGPRADGLGAATVLYRVMHAQSCMVAAHEMAEADVLIAPPISVPKMSAVDEQRLATQAGYDAARAALPQILARVGSRMAQTQ